MAAGSGHSALDSAESLKLPNTGPAVYTEVACQLLELAAAAKSPEAREQFNVLAQLYKNLAARSAKFTDVYVLGPDASVPTD